MGFIRLKGAWDLLLVKSLAIPAATLAVKLNMVSSLRPFIV